MASQVVAKTTGKLLGSFSWVVKWGIIFLVVGTIFIQAVIVSIEGKSIEPGLHLLGERFLYPTLEIYEISNKIITNEGLYIKEDNFWSGIWNLTSDSWNLFRAFVIMWLYIRIMAWFIWNFIIWDDSKKPVGYVISILTFIAIQMLLLTTQKGVPIMTPIYAFRDFFKSVPYLIEPVTKVADNVIGEKVNISSNITSAVNITS